MQIQLVGKNFEVTDAIKKYTEEEITKITKRFPELSSINIVLNVEHKSNIVEANIHYNHSDVHATAEDNDMYIAINQVINKLLTQLTKHKDKLIDSHR